MAARTNSEKIEAAEREVLKQGHVLQHLEERFRTEVGALRSESRELLVKVALLEQRLGQTEKLLDEIRTRRWQLWLALVGAATALLVALVKK